MAFLGTRNGTFCVNHFLVARQSNINTHTHTHIDRNAPNIEMVFAATCCCWHWNDFSQFKFKPFLLSDESLSLQPMTRGHFVTDLVSLSPPSTDASDKTHRNAIHFARRRYQEKERRTKKSTNQGEAIEQSGNNLLGSVWGSNEGRNAEISICARVKVTNVLLLTAVPCCCRYTPTPIERREHCMQCTLVVASTHKQKELISI